MIRIAGSAESHHAMNNGAIGKSSSVSAAAGLRLNPPCSARNSNPSPYIHCFCAEYGRYSAGRMDAE